MKKITVLGGGVLGSQIAFQTAYCGFDVTIWLLNDEAVEETKGKIKDLKKEYNKAISLMDKNEGKTMNNWCRGISGNEDFNASKSYEKVLNAFEGIKYVTDLKEAVSDADLVVESIIENLDDKNDLYDELKELLPEKTIVVTNSSTLLPSKMARHTGRPEKFLALHFANAIWKNNTAEVMAHEDTDMKCFNKVVKFAEEINMIPLELHKEKSGYLLNSMLVPFLFAAMDLYVDEISDPESIDKAWKLGTGAPNGPFEILDVVGLKTAYNIVLMYVKLPSFLAPYNFRGMERVLKAYIDKGKIGKAVGEGFYKYDKKGNRI